MGGSPSAPVIASAGRQVWARTCSPGSACAGAHAGNEGHAGAQIPEGRRHVPRLSLALGWNIDVEVARPHLAGPLVLQAREELAQDPEARGHDSARARVDALSQHLHRELAADQAAERGRRPELVVVPAGGVQADHEARRADASLQRVHVGGQVGAPALLAGLDDDDAPGVRHPLGLERLHRGERRERRVAVVGRAPAVEAVAAADGRPRPQALAPAHHLRLLVEVSVQEDGLVRRPRDLHQEDRRPARQPDDLHLEALDRTLARPARRELDRPVQVAVGLPLAVEPRRLRGDADVFLERGDDPRVPRILDESTEPIGSDRAGGGGCHDAERITLPRGESAHRHIRRGPRPDRGQYNRAVTPTEGRA